MAATAIYEASVEIQLRKGVFDPQGQAVTGALHALGHTGVADVRVGKQLRVVLQADSEQAARQLADRMCRELLANPVLEDYRLTVTALGSEVARG